MLQRRTAQPCAAKAARGYWLRLPMNDLDEDPCWPTVNNEKQGITLALLIADGIGQKALDFQAVGSFPVDDLGSSQGVFGASVLILLT